jgi:hypothetical protein
LPALPQKDPDDRYESAGQLAVDLERYLDGEPVEKSPMSWRHSMARQIQRDELPGVIPSATAAAWIAALTLTFHTMVFAVIFLELSNLILWLVLGAWFTATDDIAHRA